MTKHYILLISMLIAMAGCKKSEETQDSPSQYPGTPTAPMPANNSVNAPLAGALSWQACVDPQGDPVTYSIVVDTNANLTSPIFTAVNLSSPACTVPGLSRNTNYYWKVIASDNHNNISTGAVWKFTTTDHNFGSFTDPRDGKTYRTIVIGNKTWMADNLAYIPADGEYAYPNNDTALCTEYGILYNGLELYIETLAPPGWHIATFDEFSNLGSTSEGEHLKMPGFTYWDAPNTGSDNSTGFSAKAAGTLNNNYRQRAYFGVTYHFVSYVNSYIPFVLTYDNDYLDYIIDQYIWFSIRCVKD
jgi:uncharacterized protein (TIGR02145 family)